MTKQVSEWITFGRKSNKQIFFYQDKVLNLTGFMDQHPGGKKALINYLNKDITNILFTVFPHQRQATLNTLMKFTIGRIPQQDAKFSQKLQRSKTPTTIKERKKVCFESDILTKQTEQRPKTVPKSRFSKSAKEIKSSQLSKQKKKKENRQRSKSKEKQLIKQKEKISKQQQLASKESSNSINSDMDQEKPIFKVPVLHTKNIFTM